VPPLRGWRVVRAIGFQGLTPLANDYRPSGAGGYLRHRKPALETVNQKAIRRAKRRDRLARRVITFGGATVIASVVLIVLLIVGVTIPLFGPASSEALPAAPLPDSATPDRVACVGVHRVELEAAGGGDADSITGYVLDRNGTFTFLDFAPEPRDGAEAAQTSEVSETSEVLSTERIEAPGGAAGQQIRRVETFLGSKLSVLWSGGGVALVEAVATAHFDELGRRRVQYQVRTLAESPPEADDRLATATMIRRNEEGQLTCVRLLPDSRIAVSRTVKEESEDGPLGILQEDDSEPEWETRRRVIEGPLPGKVLALALDREGKRLVAGTDNGCLLHWDFDSQGEVVDHEVIPAFRDKRAITSLAMVQGEVSLAVGDAAGEVTYWFEVKTGDDRKLRMIGRLDRHEGPVRAILPSGRNKSLLSLGSDGRVKLDYTTSQRRLLTIAPDRPLAQVGFAPRGNAMIGLDKGGRLGVWKLENRHPEVSLATLFGKVHYESHQRPEYLWQTTGDEPKFSLVPVLFGTVKATVYAMLFAVPLALWGAIYTSHFAAPAFRRAIKPIVEIMAAVPSVVIGFLILLWLAPVLATWIVAALATVLTVPAVFIVFMVAWQWVRRYDWARRVEKGYEFVVLVPVIVVGGVAACWMAPGLESALFGGDFKQWLYDVFQRPYDPLNSLVIAVGLGFAVIPIIFSISDDALSAVPHGMTAASLALGASRWQTLRRVVLPSASPGIFAAVMIGFGRAVGETMIVFMATGSTPIMDWSPFNGFRTLSANIAMEITEAPKNSTLYRLLFLCAVLLFLMTFVLNTAAELVRARLRRKYGRY